MNEEARRNTEAHACAWHARSAARPLGHGAATERTGCEHSGQRPRRHIRVSSRVFRLMVQSGILALGAYLAIKQEISPGTIIAASIIMSRGLAPIEQAVGKLAAVPFLPQGLDRLDQVLDAVPASERPDDTAGAEGLARSRESHGCRCKAMTSQFFRASTSQVKPGTGLGVIGPTGAGKSTLSRTLVGVIEPTRGKRPSRWRDPGPAQRGRPGTFVGYLPQDVQLFDGTVAQNISRFARSRMPNPKISSRLQPWPMSTT